MNTKKITIIIPVYNGSKHINKCLDSIAKQTFKDYVILIINDGSNDDSDAIIQEWRNRHSQISLELISQENKGAAAARNKGIALACTEYISFVDQDDIIAPDYLGSYFEAIETTNADIICGGYTHKYTSTKEITRRVQLKNSSWAKFVVVAPWAHLYRTAFLKENPIRFLETKLGEDVYFSLTAYAYTDQITIIPDIGYTWTNNPNSHSNKEQKKVQNDTDPFILLNAIDRDIPKTAYITNIQLEYYLYRYIVWYLLFTAKQSGKKEIEEQYYRLMAWLKERYPNFRNNRMISLFGPRGEPLSIRMCVCGFSILDKTHFLLPFLKMLSKRQR